jgi:nitrogen PTS system EIIA component
MLRPAYATTNVATRPRPGVAPRMAHTALAAILTPADIVLDLDVPTKKRAFDEIAQFVGARHNLLAEDVHASLADREKIGSTALGQGIAIPHARVHSLSHPVAAFVRLKIAIPFDAPDGKPVSDMLVLLVPEDATDAHLQVLAEIAEMFCDKSFRDRLRACDQVAEVHTALTGPREV